MRLSDGFTALVDRVARLWADELQVFEVAPEQVEVCVVAAEDALEGRVVFRLRNQVHIAAVVAVEHAVTVDALSGRAEALAPEAGVDFGML